MFHFAREIIGARLVAVPRTKGATMRTWTAQHLAAIAIGDDFHLAPYRDDGASPGTMIWVWAVPVNGDVYVRSATPDSRWFAAARRQRAGRARGAGFDGEVVFEHVEAEHIKDLVDAAYTAKYGRDPYFSDDLLARSRHQIAKVTPATGT